MLTATTKSLATNWLERLLIDDGKGESVAASLIHQTLMNNWQALGPVFAKAVQTCGTLTRAGFAIRNRLPETQSSFIQHQEFLVKMVRALYRVALAAGVVMTLAPTGMDAQRNGTCWAGEPRWSHGVVLTGAERDAVKSMPITQRPYRPLHFYGNTVRRIHYRGTPLPAPRDLVGAGAATILRR